MASSDSDDEGADGGGAAQQQQQQRWLTGYCHSGMGQGALFLGAKFAPLLHPLYCQGYQVSLVGHSLGAGKCWLACPVIPSLLGWAIAWASCL